MGKRRVLLLMGFVIVLGGWWLATNGSAAQSEEGVLDVWATWGDGPDQLEGRFDRYSQSSGIPVAVTTRVRSDNLLKALAGSGPPDMVILSGADLISSYNAQGLVEPLDRWIEGSGIDLEDIYPAPLGQCQVPEGKTLCLPWGGDVYALFWNKALFEAAGLAPDRPPQTMEKLVEYAERLTVRDEQGELVQVGFIPDLISSHTDLTAAMLGGFFYRSEGDDLSVNSRPVIDALNWQLEFYNMVAPNDLTRFASSFTPYMASPHPVYAGRRMSCQQCHRSAPIQKKKTPDTGLIEGRVAMMLDGQWQVGPGGLAQMQSGPDFGVAPFPPPAVHPERAGTSLVQGPVVFIPAGAVDKERAVQLLAWMMSPEVVADAAYANGSLPTSRAAAEDPRFREIPNLGVFMDLMAQPNAGHAIGTPISRELNEALGEVEGEVLHTGGDPVMLLDDLQAELGLKLEEALANPEEP